MRVWTEWAASQLEAWTLVSQGLLEEATGNRWGPFPELLCFGDSYILFDDHGGFFWGEVCGVSQ